MNSPPLCVNIVYAQSAQDDSFMLITIGAFLVQGRNQIVITVNFMEKLYALPDIKRCLGRERKIPPSIK